MKITERHVKELNHLGRICRDSTTETFEYLTTKTIFFNDIKGQTIIDFSERQKQLSLDGLTVAAFIAGKTDGVKNLVMNGAYVPTKYMKSIAKAVFISPTLKQLDFDAVSFYSHAFEGAVDKIKAEGKSLYNQPSDLQAVTLASMGVYEGNAGWPAEAYLFASAGLDAPGLNVASNGFGNEESPLTFQINVDLAGGHHYQ